MREAYDTFLQEIVNADVANGKASNEYYRYVCIHCGETVGLAAKNSYSMVAHFRHRHGNNDVECEEYLGKYGTLARKKYDRKDKVEFYFNDHTKCFYFGIKYDENEIAEGEAQGAQLKIKANKFIKPFYTQEINSRNFIPNELRRILVASFSKVYYICDSRQPEEKPYMFFRENFPIVFKVLGSDLSDFDARLISSERLYTNTHYVIMSVGNNIAQNRIKRIEEISVERNFDFDSMNQHMWAAVFCIKKKTGEVEKFFSEYGYTVDTLEEITLLWPPGYQNEDIYVVESDDVYLESSFVLQAHGNINVNDEDILWTCGNVTKLAIKGQAKIKKDNADLKIIKAAEKQEYNKNSFEMCYVKVFTVPEENKCYLFSITGVRLLEIGEKIVLTPNSYVCEYSSGHLVRIWRAENILPLQGENLLNDILKHYKVEQSYIHMDITGLSGVASKYIKRCEDTGTINSLVKKYIEEEKI